MSLLHLIEYRFREEKICVFTKAKLSCLTRYRRFDKKYGECHKYYELSSLSPGTSTLMYQHTTPQQFTSLTTTLQQFTSLTTTLQQFTSLTTTLQQFTSQTTTLQQFTNVSSLWQLWLALCRAWYLGWCARTCRGAVRRWHRAQLCLVCLVRDGGRRATADSSSLGLHRRKHLGFARLRYVTTGDTRWPAAATTCSAARSTCAG